MGLRNQITRLSVAAGSSRVRIGACDLSTFAIPEAPMEQEEIKRTSTGR